MSELLALADDETRALWDGLTLGYAESTGHPLLRREIAALYDGLEPDDVLVFAGAEEGIFCLVNVLLGPGDHAVVTWPGYQSLYEIGRATGADVTLHELREDAGWAARSRPAPPAGHAGDEAHRRERAAQPDRDAARPRRRSTASWPSPRKPARTCSWTRSTGSSSSKRPIGCRRRRRHGARRLAGRHVEIVRDGRAADRLAGHSRSRPARTLRVVQGLHDDLRLGAVGDPGDHRATRARDGPGPISRDRRREHGAARRVLRRVGRPLHLGAPAGRIDRVPAADRAGRRHRRLGGRAGRNGRRLVAAGFAIRVSAATTSGWASGGRTCRRPSNGSKRTRPERFADPARRSSAPHRNHPYCPRLHHVPDVRMGLGQDLHGCTVASRNRPARDPEPRRLLSPFGVGGR